MINHESPSVDMLRLKEARAWGERFLAELPGMKAAVKAHPLCANLQNERVAVCLQHVEDQCLGVSIDSLTVRGWSCGFTINDSVFVRRRDGMDGAVLCADAARAADDVAAKYGIQLNFRLTF